MVSLWPATAQGLWKGSHLPVWGLKYFNVAMLTGFRLCHRTEVGVCLRFVPLHLYWAVSVAPLCPVDYKSIPQWQTPYTNNTSSRFMELLFLIQFCLVIPCWKNICGFGFFTFFPTPKTCLVENTLHMSLPVSMFSHVAGFFMLTMSVDMYMESYGYTAKSPLSESLGHPCFHLFLFQDKEWENKAIVQLFLWKPAADKW